MVAAQRPRLEGGVLLGSELFFVASCERLCGDF